MGAIEEVIIDRGSFELFFDISECWNENPNSHSVKKVNNNTVNMICDFIDYLIKFNVNVSINVEKNNFLRLQHYTTNDQNLVDKSQFHKTDAMSIAVVAGTPSTITVTLHTKNEPSGYTSFDELLRLSERQRRLEALGFNASRCLRLRGGGESSLNNGTSAWGSPPTNANTGASWGAVAPQQQGGWGNTPPNANQRPDLGKQMQQPPQGSVVGGPMGGSGNGSNSWNQVVNPNKPPLQPPPQQQVPQPPNQPPPPGAGNPGNSNNQPPSAQQQQQPPQPQNQQPPGGNPQLAAQPGAPVQSSSSKLEHLNSMREALFSQDGWGCQHVNQDTQWDVPASPEPANKDLKINFNNGTELWETNLRNGGQPTQQPTQKTPWGPSNNIGGTWGVDDDSNAENNSVWTGGAAGGANPPVAGQQQNWNQNNNAMWPPNVANAPPKKEPEWAGGNVAVPGGANNWENRGTAAPPPPHIPAPPLDMPNVDMRNMRPPGAIEPSREFRGDPRGISGRLNGSSGMWDQHPMPNTPLNKMPPQAPMLNAAGGNQWPVGAGGPQNIPPSKPQTSWDEASPPASRRNMSNLDDGTSLWGAPTNPNRPNGPNEGMVRNGRNPLGGNSGPIGPGGLGGPRLGGPGNPMKSDMWGHGGPGPMRNGSWDDSSNNWEDKGPGGPLGGGGGGVGAGGGSTWNDGPGNPSTWNNKKPIVGGGNVWPETSDLIGGNDWGTGIGVGKPPNKHNPQEIIRSSKQFRILYEMGFKKEDIEQALRTANMSLEEAMEMLQRNNGNNMPDWRRHDDHPGGFEPPFSSGRFPGGGAGPSLPFPQNQNGPNNNMPGGMGGGNPNLAGLNSLSKPLQSYLNQAPPSGPGPFNQGGPNVGGIGGGAGGVLGGGGAGQNSSAQPSTQQLRMLVQQIQMAVQAGYLNHQILNQPLAPQTLFLLNQLLNNIKQLQVTQNNLQRGGGASNNQMSMIPKIKQQIAGLQNQIATQQSIYVKQQQQQQHSGNTSNINHLANNFHRGEPNDLTTLHNSLSEMALGKDHNGPYHHGPGGGGGGGSGGGGGGGSTSQQSRLNQWKLPAVDKDGGHDLTDFSRAPGTTAKSTLSTTGSTISGLSGLQGDNTWSTGRGGIGDGWPDSSADTASKDWPSNQDSFTDLVPEFEPGKPWKGTQMKIEEDPTITPGSIARSPIASISIASAKDSDLFANSSKPSPTDSLSLSSSTWSFNASNNNFSSSISKLGGAGKNTWSDAGASDLWGTGLGSGAGGGKTPRGPPPGLSAGKTPGGFGSNGWNQRPGQGGSNWPAGGGGAGGPAWYSTWILLKNLTAQIDGPTLRTLCMQHGPLQNFHLYLNHGIALCKYQSREEANKAQQALNNCVLGNTTICAESPTDSEVQTILQHLGVPGGNNNNNNNNGNMGSAGGGLGNNNNAQPWRTGGSQQSNVRSTDTWGSGWPSSAPAINPWSLDGPTERGTPSNLNSFLPENLLGGDLN